MLLNKEIPKYFNIHASAGSVAIFGSKIYWKRLFNLMLPLFTWYIAIVYLVSFNLKKNFWYFAGLAFLFLVCFTYKYLIGVYGLIKHRYTILKKVECRIDLLRKLPDIKVEPLVNPLMFNPLKNLPFIFLLGKVWKIVDGPEKYKGRLLVWDGLVRQHQMGKLLNHEGHLFFILVQDNFY
jgi:hypothetical protein